MPPFDVLYAIEPDWCKDLPRPQYKDLERVKTTDDWFEVYRVHSGTYAIYEPRQYEEVISFLILGSKEALLLDTGMGIGDLKKVVKELTFLPVRVLNTHTHPDHVGNNYQFENILGMDMPFTKRNEAGFRNSELKEWVNSDHVCGKLPEGFDRNSYLVKAYSIKDHVRDGEILDLGDRNLEILFTPGHTPDSLCLIDRKNRLLFTGDSYYPGPIYLFAKETDLKLYAQSVRKLAALQSEVDTVLPSHNLPVVSPDVLGTLNRAVQEVMSGTAKGKRKDDLMEYQFEGFSLLIR